MLLYKTQNKNMTKKSLSMHSGYLRIFLTLIPGKLKRTKALQCARSKGSFTIESAFVVPLFLFAAVVVLGLFQLLQVQIQVDQGLQYATRTIAASYCDADKDMDPASELIMQARGRLLFQRYLKEHDCREDVIKNGFAGISFAGTDFSGEYVTMQASYRIKLPVSFWGIQNISVSHCVKSRKWIGAVPEDDSGEDGAYVYVTEHGSAYHKSTSCRYLDLSIRSVSVNQIETLRSKDGNIYRKCSCYKKGQSVVYVTDYGIQYHGSLSCSDLKRTVYKVKKEDVGAKHPCAKCYGGN